MSHSEATSPATSNNGQNNQNINSETTYPNAQYNGRVHSPENFVRDKGNQIQGIIARRQKQAQQIQQVRKNLSSRQETLKNLELMRQDLSRNSNLAARLAEHDFTSILESIDFAKEELDNLEKRLSRQTLNIGVVGRMRNGKSRLLQSLTGLGDQEIPTSSKGVCTRGLSKVFHVSNPEDKRNEIEFHSWSSFKEIIHLYFDRLGLPNKPVVPDDMARGQRPPGLPKDRKGDINARYLYGRLCKEYYGKFDQYRGLLDGSTKQIGTSEISKYITHNEMNSQGEYLAVKELRVFCQFPYQDVGQVGVIDLPGLGDDNIFDLERLITTLKQDVDVILFVRMPKPTGDDWEEADRKMFQTAREALGEFPLSDCSFVVLNRIKEGNVDNYELCQIFDQKIHQQEITINHDPIIANCSDPGEINQNILTPVLNYLTNNSELVYQEYLQSCNRRLQVLQGDIGKQVKNAEQAIAGYSEEGDLEFDLWFDRTLRNDLNSGLHKLLDRLRNQQKIQDETFKAAVKAAIDKCNGEAIVPKVEEIEETKYNFKNSYRITYLVYVDQIRFKLSNNFNSLGDSLGALLEEVQVALVDVLVQQGRLGKLTPKRGIEFFEDISKQLPKSAIQLRKGFQDIQKRSNSYDQIVKEWIKDYLEELLPDELPGKKIDPISQGKDKQNRDDNLTLKKVTDFIEEFKDQDNSELTQEIREISKRAITQEQIDSILETSLNSIGEFILNQYQENEEQIQTADSSEEQLSYAELIEKELQALRKNVVDRCYDTLQEELTAPNEMAFTMIRDFLDQVLANKDAETEWRIFLKKNQDRVWDGAKQKHDYEVVENNWLKLVDSAQEANKTENLRLSLNNNNMYI